MGVEGISSAKKKKPKLREKWIQSGKGDEVMPLGFIQTTEDYLESKLYNLKKTRVVAT